MSEDHTSFSSHSSCDQRVHSDVDAVRSAIDALLADVEHVGVMTPLDHLDWALALPLCMGISRPPEMLRRAVHRSRAFGHRGLEAYRQKTLASWFERKRVLGPTLAAFVETVTFTCPSSAGAEEESSALA